MRVSSPSTPRGTTSKATFGRSPSSGSLARLGRCDSASTFHAVKKAAQIANEEKPSKSKSSCLKQAKERGFQAVGPTLSALVAASQLALGGDGLNLKHDQVVRQDRNIPPAYVRSNMVFTGPPTATRVSETPDTNRQSRSRAEAQHHMPMSVAPLSTNPLSKTPFASSRAPEFPESRSRMTLAERAAAAMREQS
eukprot:CAMPEP_0206148834 /NCGR_PEP_ID=MMETSP1473-20131121/37458_1 /ASSEMBLY_ACC=CAM_ASM_001109 /TAXON_ID=1461547 /ORGANISM="Stichococcus sp, Strain RCC1054" /LENGTH=193 /DNA_ID=CAMNT_0053546257 /DNA_START=956 /DNA_END=1537 /DNA_ORIENTATION=-